MRIAMVTSVLGSAGGMGRIVEEFAERLARRGHEVTVFAPGSHPGTKPLLRFGNAAWVPGLAKMLDGFDIVHLHYPFIGGAGAVLRWKRRAKQGKLLVTYHMDLIGRGLTRPLFAIYSWLTTPRLLRAASAITASSFDYLEHSTFARFFKLRRNYITEIPFGVDIEKFAPRSRDTTLLAKLGVQPEESVVLFVGKLDAAHYFKGVGILLEAFAFLRKEARNIRLLIVGDGNRKKYYEQLASRLKINDFVIFAGTVLPPDLPSYYALADVLVLPSQTRSEAFGLVLLEAQASGVPVIASNLPGVRTVVEDGKTGYLVEPSNRLNLVLAMARILTRSDERTSMGEAARAWTLANYRWETVIDKLETLYRLI